MTIKKVRKEGEFSLIMYVCLCVGVTETQIRQAIADGCHSIKALQDELGVGIICGKCIEMIECILQETAIKMPMSTDEKTQS